MKICSRCGKKVEETLVKRYKKADLPKSLFWCDSCINQLPTGIKRIFNTIEENLNEKNAKEFRRMKTPMKATVARDFIKKDIIKGGTIGQTESLRTLVASGLNLEEEET